MSVYVKGAVAAVLVIMGAFIWYRASVHKLPVNQSPRHYQIIDQMEKVGMPDFELERIGEPGGTLKLSDLKGKIIIVNFWASWCNPCLEEFPSMIKLVERTAGDVVIVAVSGDDNKADIETFMKAFGLPKPGVEVLWDKDKAAIQAYGVEKLPESYIVDANFKLVRKIIGIEDWASDSAFAFFMAVKEGRAGPNARPNPPGPKN